jgi:hypothetical protein
MAGMMGMMRAEDGRKDAATSLEVTDNSSSRIVQVNAIRPGLRIRSEDLSSVVCGGEELLIIKVPSKWTKKIQHEQWSRRQ